MQASKIAPTFPCQKENLYPIAQSSTPLITENLHPGDKASVEDSAKFPSSEGESSASEGATAPVPERAGPQPSAPAPAPERAGILSIQGPPRYLGRATIPRRWFDRDMRTLHGTGTYTPRMEGTDTGLDSKRPTVGTIAAGGTIQRFIVRPHHW